MTHRNRPSIDETADSGGSRNDTSRSRSRLLSEQANRHRDDDGLTVGDASIHDEATRKEARTGAGGPVDDTATEVRGPLDEAQYEYEESYNVAPPTMPPAAAGANAEIGGEAAASRRHAGLPRRLLHEPEHRPDEPTPGNEPILGYDGMDVDTLLDWIEDADPSPVTLEALIDYERTHRDREAVVDECVDRLRRFSGPSMS